MKRPPGDAGERDRLTRWVREHGPAVWGFLKARVGDRAVADDLLQEVFFRAWEAKDRYLDVGKDRAYLLTIADRLSIGRGRKKKAVDLPETGWKFVEPSVDDDGPMDRLLQNEAEECLNVALEALSEPQRRTLLLRYFGDLDFADIAKQLGCPLSTALSHARRGLLALRQMLAKETV